jgi:integrase
MTESWIRSWQRRRNPVSGTLGHTVWHTYRSWLDAVGAPLPVQQKLMRHADSRTAMNIYGDMVTNEMAQAHGKIVGLVLNRAPTERKPS